MNIHPLGSRVLIKRKDITKINGIIIPKTSQEAQVNLGEIVAIGPACNFLHAGDVVTFGRYAPLKILKEELQFYGIDTQFEPDTTYLLMNEEDVLCIISDESPNERNTVLENIGAQED